MAQEEIIVDIEEGNCSFDLKGFHGKGCKELTKAFAQIGKVTKETTKPEYYQEGPGHGVLSQGR